MTKLSSDKRQLFKYTVVLCFVLATFALQGQSKLSDNLSISANYQMGYSLPEYSVFTLITNDYIRSFELSITKETTGKTEWEQAYHFPAHGLSIYYSNLGNDDVLGKEFALNYFIKLYLLSKGRFQLYNITAGGIGYVSKIFSLENNYLNVLVGSHFNLHFNLRFGTHYKLSEKVSVNTGLSFDHFSNANAASPNVGINTFTAYGGLSYLIGKRTERIDTVIEKHIPKNSYYLFTGIGGKHTQSLSATYFLTSSLSFEAKRAITRGFHFGVGLDFFYDSSVKSELNKENRNYKGIYDFQTGIHISQAIVYNKFSIALYQGVYVGLQDHVGRNIIYNKGVFQYNLVKNVTARVSMKSHLHILDYPELGVGIQF
ncbi:MAG: hypothetical protein ACJA0Q_000368 [Saprospiraceae bacterium]|jgi:hypothetical protein